MIKKALFWLVLVGCLAGCHKIRQPTAPPRQQYFTEEEIKQITCRGAQAICIEQLGGIYQDYEVNIDCRGPKIAYSGLVQYQCDHPQNPFVPLKENEPGKHRLTVTMICQNVRQRCRELAQIGESELVVEEYHKIIKCQADRITVQSHQRRYGHQVICRRQLIVASPRGVSSLTR